MFPCVDHPVENFTNGTRSSPKMSSSSKVKYSVRYSSVKFAELNGNQNRKKCTQPLD